jgi:NadR type nicotinamide-nucleotide adenylyltransferase
LTGLPRRIVVTGSEATGKTTLAAELAAALGTIWVPEYSREYAAARGGILTAADVEPIARGQRAAEEAALATTAGVVVFDTDLVSTAVYARHYYGVTVAWVEEAIRGYPSGLYLLCDIDLPWTADGIRDRGEAREAIQVEFTAALERRGLRFAVIRGLGRDRLAAAMAAISRGAG